MTETLHTRLLGYLAKLNPRKSAHDVIGEVGLTLAKEIDKLTARPDALGQGPSKPHGEPDV